MSLYRARWQTGCKDPGTHSSTGYAFQPEQFVHGNTELFWICFAPWMTFKPCTLEKS